MVQCSSCGKKIEKIPDWLATTKVEYVCDNCPNRSYKNIAFVQLETAPKEVEEDETPEVAADEEA